MSRNLDSWLLPTLFACLLLMLAKAMAAEKTENTPSKVFAEPRTSDEEVAFVKPSVVSAAPAKDEADRIPSFSIKDPLGVEHPSAKLYGSTGMLVMLTVPNLTQYERQQRWEKWVAKQKWPEHYAPQRVLIEDLSQQQMFKEKARGLMKDKYDPNGDVVVLIDETGCVRRQFGVDVNETVIFLINANGKIVHSEGDDVEPDRISAQRLISHVRQLAESNTKTAESQPKPVAVASR